MNVPAGRFFCPRPPLLWLVPSKNFTRTPSFLLIIENKEMIHSVLALLCATLLFAPSPAGAGFLCDGGGLLFSRNGRYFAAGWGGQIQTISFGTFNDKKFYKSISMPRGQCLFGLSPDGKTLAASYGTGQELLRLSMGGEILSNTAVPQGALTSVSPSFRYAATTETLANGSDVYRIYRLSGGQFSPLYVLADQSEKGWGLFSPGDKYLAYHFSRLNKDGRVAGSFVNMLELKTGKSAVSFQFKEDPLSQISALAFSPDGKLFAYGSVSGETRVVAVPGWAPAKTLRDRGHTVRSIYFSTAHMAVLYGSGTVKVYRLPGFETVYAKDYEKSPHAINFTANGKELGVLFLNGRVSFVPLASGKPSPKN